MMTPTADRIPGLREWPLLGSAPALRRDPLGVHARVARECGPIGCFHLGPLRAVLLNSPDLIRSFLLDHARDYDKGTYLHRAFDPFARRGLFVSEGELHRTQRKLVAPLFQPRRVAGYADTIVAHADRLGSSLAEGQTLDLAPALADLGMIVVTDVLLGTDVPGEPDELREAVDVVLGWLGHALTGVVPVPLWVPTPRNRRANRARAMLHQRLGGLIASRRASAAARGDLLSALLLAHDEEGRGMDDEQIYDEVLTAFIAGHETMANALAWTFALLTRHPDCYDRLQREVDGALAGRAPTLADLPRLPYALQVFKEAMRLYPPAPAVVRIALRDTALGGYPIRKGTAVLVSLYVLHRRAEDFPDPERFDPDRFSPERERQLPRYAYLPFGAGHRTCIGSHFALLEGHLIVATLAARVRFEALGAAPLAPEFALTLRPKGGVPVRVRRHAAALPQA